MFLFKLLCLIISFTGGVVVHHWIARRIFSASKDISEQEILLHGLLASIIINGTIGTYLSLLKIFNLYSFAAIFILLLFFLRSDLLATFLTTKQTLVDWRESLCKFNLLTIGTTILVVSFTTILIALCYIPNQNPDGWVFHFPIALSIVKNSGFIYPIIDHIHYANQPSFVSVLFAEALLVHNHFAIASAVNVLIYLFTFVALAAVWKNTRLALCILIIVVGLNFNLVTGVPTLLTDMTRTCFSVLGFSFLALGYARGVAYYSGLAAICIGAAIATKYTELISLSIMGLALLPNIRTKEGRFLIIKCSALVIIIASFWYLKNLVLLHNPIYPFLFGHPGLSDAWMKDYLLEMTLAFDPAHRHFVRNLFTAQGWVDFLTVFWSWFFQENPMAKLCLIITAIGALKYRKLIAPMFAITLFLFTYWYVVLFNHIRWAKPAIMLLFITTCFVLLITYEIISTQQKQKQKSIKLIKTFWKKYKLGTLILLGTFFGLLILLISIVAPNSTKTATRWTFMRAAEPVFAVFTPGGVDKYLSKTRDGYSIIRYVIDNDLHGVFQPFQDGISTYVQVYNGGLDGDWFINIGNNPADLINCHEFSSKTDIKYYVVRPELKELDKERLGQKNLQTAFAIINCLQNGSELILEDINGWKLYKVNSQKESNPKS